MILFIYIQYTHIVFAHSLSFLSFIPWNTEADSATCIKLLLFNVSSFLVISQKILLCSLKNLQLGDHQLVALTCIIIHLLGNAMTVNMCFLLQVRLVISEKGLVCEERDVSLPLQEHKEPWFMRLNLGEEVPVFLHGDTIITDYNQIIDYLEKTFVGGMVQ